MSHTSRSTCTSNMLLRTNMTNEDELSEVSEMSACKYRLTAHSRVTILVSGSHGQGPHPHNTEPQNRQMLPWRRQAVHTILLHTTQGVSQHKLQKYPS